MGGDELATDIRSAAGRSSYPNGERMMGTFYASCCWMMGTVCALCCWMIGTVCASFCWVMGTGFVLQAGTLCIADHRVVEV